MNPVSQILKYFLVVSLMVPMLSMALIVAPFSSSTGWRIVRSWNVRMRGGVCAHACEYARQHNL